MVVGARIVITSNRNSGNIKGSSKDTKYLGGIFDELKKMSKGLINSSKLSRAGLGGGLLKGGVGTTASIAAIVAAAAAGLNEMFKSENPKTDGGSNISGPVGGASNALAGILAGHKDYKKVIMDGKEVVVQWDEKNKEIVRVLTKQQAIDEKILDRTGKLKTRYQEYYTSIDELSSKLKKIRDNTIISKNKSDTIVELNDEEIKLRNELNEAIQEQINSVKKTHHSHHRIISKPVEDFIGDTENVSRPDNWVDWNNLNNKKQSIDPNFGNDTLQSYSYWRP